MEITPKAMEIEHIRIKRLNIMAVGVVKPQLNVYHSLPYSISLFFLQVKPFYTDMFYLRKPLELSP